MWMADKPILLDTNVLIATAPSHIQAHELLEKLWAARVELWISRQIVRESIAVVSRQQTFSQPQVTERLLDLLNTIPLGGGQIHDANLVATMLVYGIPQLLTYNAPDFARFSTLITVLTEQEIVL